MADRAPKTDWLERQAYAHRGLHGGAVPENSLAAFAAAIAAGLGIECDVRKAGDGRAIVFHDTELERMTGRTGRLGDHSVGDLTAMTLQGSQESIPTLRDTLELIDGQVPLLLELKTERGRPVGPLCRAVRRDCEGYAGPYAIMSFDPRVAQWFARRQPEAVRGLVVTEQGARTLSGTLRRHLALRKARPHFLAYDIRDLPGGFAAARRRAGLPLLSWTVRSAAQLATAREAGATPILEGPGVAVWQAHP